MRDIGQSSLDVYRTYCDWIEMHTLSAGYGCGGRDAALSPAKFDVETCPYARFSLIRGRQR